MRSISLQNVRGRLRRPAWQGVAVLFVGLGVALALWAKVLPTLAKPAHPISNNTQRLATELAHLKMLGHALRLHAEEHDGKYPPAISEIQWRQEMPGMDWNGLPAAVSRFHHPDDGRVLEWLYYQGKTEADPPETILAASPVAVGAKGDHRLVVRASGVGEIIPEEDFQHLGSAAMPCPSSAGEGAWLPGGCAGLAGKLPSAYKFPGSSSSDPHNGERGCSTIVLSAAGSVWLGVAVMHPPGLGLGRSWSGKWVKSTTLTIRHRT